MEYIFSHLAQTLIVVGLILLAIEVLVLGFSTFVLFFIGIGTIITGILMLFGNNFDNSGFSELATIKKNAEQG